MAAQAVEFDETTATPLPGAQPSQSVTFDDSTAVPLPKSAPVQAQPAGADGANQPFSPADRARYTRPVNPGLATPPPAQQTQPNPSLQAPPATPVAPANSGVPGIPQKHPANNPANPVYHPGENGVPNVAETPLAPVVGNAAMATMRALWPFGTANFDAYQARGEKDQAAFDAAHPIFHGAASGVNEMLEGMTTPANIGLIAAAPESKVVTALFAAQAAQGTYKDAQHAYQAYKDGNNPEAAKYITEAGLSAAVAALAGTHAADPRITTGPYGAKGVRVGGDTFGAEVGTTPAYRQPGPTGSYSPDEGSTVVPRQTTAGARVGPVAVGSMRTSVAPPVEIPPAVPTLPAPTPGPVIEGEGIPIPKPAAPAPAAQAPNLSQAEAALTGKPIEGVAPPAPTIQPTPDAARPPVQASTEPAEIRESAQEQKPDLKQMATAVAQAVPGAEVVGPRVKSADSIDNKEDRGKPVESNIDNLGVRVVAPNPDAVPAVQQAVEQSLPVVQKDKIDNNGLNIPQYGVKTGDKGDANQVSELQVIPSPEVADAMKETDPLYAQQKEAIARGDQPEADRLGAQIQGKLDEARKATPGGNEGGKPEQAVGAAKPAPAAITKGAQVTLPDGTNGAVQHVNPNYSSGGRVVVQTPNGVKTFKGSELKPVENAPGPVGAPIPARVAQIKEVAAKGTPVKIFTARGDDPEVKQWLQQQGLGNLPVTNVKGHDFGALLDNEVNVPTNSDKPFEMPAVPAGKALYVDLDGTLAREKEGTASVVPEEKSNEQRNSTEQPASAVAEAPKPKEGEETHADEITSPAPRAVGEGPESGAEVRGRHAERVEAAGETAVERAGGKEDGAKEVAKQPKHKHGNTQADIPPNSDAGRALAKIRNAIDPADLMGDGLVEDSHITVRYGIDGDDTAGIRAYLEKQPSFEASLGKTQAFPASEHSDGAVPIIVPVESADLHRMEKEIDGHGNFVERSFPEYKPHATVAYVKPGEAKRYTGMTEADGKKFKVESVSISKKNGTVEEVKLKGSTKPQFSAAARAKIETKPETKQERRSFSKSQQPKPAKIETPLDKFEGEGKNPYEITQKEWVDLQKAHRAALGQDQTSGTKAAPYADYEEYHRDSVKNALRMGLDVPKKVLKDYPDLAPKPAAPVKTEADAVAPGTAEPTKHERLVAERDRLTDRLAEIPKQMSAIGMMDVRAVRKLGDERDRVKAKLATIEREIENEKRETAQIARRDAIPLSKPEEKLVTDPDQNKWKYQAEYFVKALEPTKQAWLDTFPNFGKDDADRWAYLVKHSDGMRGLPKEFPDNFIRIEVPHDGKFLVKNTPAAIDKLLKSAPRAFAQPGKAPTGKVSIPRAPKELDTATLIQKFKAEIDETEQDLERARPQDKAFLQDKLKAARENLAEAEKLQKTGEESPVALTNLTWQERALAAIRPLSASAVSARAETRPVDENEPTASLVLNADAYAIIQNKMGFLAGQHWDGIILGKEDVDVLVQKLNAKGVESGSIAGRRSLSDLAKQLASAASKSGVAILYAGEPRPDTIEEEQLHGWQISSGVHRSEAVQDAILNIPLGKEIDDALGKAGYPRDKARRASEVAAKAVTGEMLKDGFTETQRAEILSTYFDAVAQAVPKSLEQLPQFDKATKDAIESAKEKHGKSGRLEGRSVGDADGRRSEIQRGDEGSGKKTEPLTRLAKDTGRVERDEPGAGDRTGLAEKLYSGFGDPELFKQLFPDVAQRIADWIKDPSGPGVDQKAMMRETRGQMDRRVAIAIHALRKESKAWRTRSREDSMKFWNAVEQGNVGSLPPKDQALAAIFKQAFDQMRDEIQALKPEVLRNYYENYFPHIWEKPSLVTNAIRKLLNGKRPFAGKASFLKKRTIPTMQDGIDLGFKPKSWNPVDSFLIKYAEMAQFLMAHQTLQMNKKAGTAKYVRLGKRAPDGWVQADDRIGTVYGREKILNEDKLDEATYEKRYMEGEKGIPSVAREDVDEATSDATIIRGHYYMPAEAAKVFNNFVSRGMAGRSVVYDSLNWLNQNLNALQLGISAFHASTTSINAATSDVALGIQQLAEGKPLKAGYSLAKGLSVAPSVIRTMVNGSHLLRQYLDPGSYAKMAKEAASLAQAGGRVRQNVIELKPLDRIINAWRNGAVIQGLTPIPGAILHAAVAPVMDYYVPRMKLGAFYAMAHDILDEAQKGGWDDAKTRARMQEAWDSIDNRFGQMVYDNLFWHKGLRDSVNLATRSVGWNFGTIREIGGAIPDAVRAAGQASTGKMPRVTPRMAFAMALPIVSALVGGILTYLWTGKKPETWKDYFYPRTANGERHSIPGYMKDVFSYAHDPVRTALNKLAPLWQLTSEAIENRDFYGTEIRHKDDPLMKQLVEFASWTAKQAIPFSFSGGAQLLKQRGAGPSLGEMLHAAKEHPGDVALGQLGFQPAPAFIQNSPAMNLAREYAMVDRPPGTKTKEQADHYDAMDAVVKMYRTGDVDQKQIDDYVDKGVLTDKDVDKAEKESDEDPLARAIKGLSAEQIVNVYEKATPDERDAIEDYVDHIRQSDRRDDIEDGIDKINGKEAPPAEQGGGA